MTNMCDPVYGDERKRRKVVYCVVVDSLCVDPPVSRLEFSVIGLEFSALQSLGKGTEINVWLV